MSLYDMRILTYSSISTGQMWEHVVLALEGNVYAALTQQKTLLNISTHEKTGQNNKNGKENIQN